MTRVEPDSAGDAAAQTLTALEEQFAALAPAPRDAGRVALIVRRMEHAQRETPERVTMTPELGIAGDAWGRQREPAPDAQLTVMQLNIAELIANGRPLTLFGDNLFFDLDLSAANLPPRSRVQAGGVVLEVTPMPHTGCGTFRSRFGDGALRFVSKRELRHLNLRGIYMRVVEGGELAVGDPVEVTLRRREPREMSDAV